MFGWTQINLVLFGDSQDIGHVDKLKAFILQSQKKNDVKITKAVHKNGETEKLEIVSLSMEEDQNEKSLSERFGISQNSTYNWRLK